MNGGVEVFRGNNYIRKSGYDLDLWKEIKCRWMVLGVLVAVALAVIAPALGAPGGRLHAEYLSYIPLTYIYYTAGKTARFSQVSCVRLRLYVLTVVHAYAASPALCVFTITALRDAGLDSRVIEGALLASGVGPCAWLPLSLRGGTTLVLAAVTSTASLLTAPFYHVLFCGRLSLPSPTTILVSILSTLPPFMLGVLRRGSGSADGNKVSALLLLYGECCTLFNEAGGGLYVWDVLATLCLELSWLVTVAASTSLYVKCGVLDSNEASHLLLTSLPKATHIGWHTTSCRGSGLSKLPIVFLAPTQALLLAAIYTDQENVEGLPK